eukprot:1457887-Amphidinium_carterae.1
MRRTRPHQAVLRHSNRMCSIDLIGTKARPRGAKPSRVCLPCSDSLFWILLCLLTCVPFSVIVAAAAAAPVLLLPDSSIW